MRHLLVCNLGAEEGYILNFHGCILYCGCFFFQLQIGCTAFIFNAAYFAVILLQVSPCNERAVLDQLSDHLKKRLAGYKSSSTIEVSRCIGFIKNLQQTWVWMRLFLIQEHTRFEKWISCPNGCHYSSYHRKFSMLSTLCETYSNLLKQQAPHHCSFQKIHGCFQWVAREASVRYGI